MTRDAYTDRLLDLAYGELAGREAREVEAHAASCEACRAELARIRATRRIMAALPDEPAPDRGERILVAAAREAAEARRPRRLVPRWLLGGAVAAASVAVVAVVSYRVLELAPGRDEATALLGPSPYASPPPAAEERPGDANAGAEAGAPEGNAAAPALEAKRAPAAPPRAAAAPRTSRAEPPPGGAEAHPTFAAPPPPAPAPPRASEPESRARTAAPEADASAAPAAAAGAAVGYAPHPAAPGAAGEAAQERAAPGAARKSVAAPRLRAETEPAPPFEAPYRTEVRTIEGCAGEARREVEMDARGRVVSYVREGTFAGRRLVIRQTFRPDGELDTVTVHGAPDPVSREELQAALGPGFYASLPRRADDARIDAPPRCGR